MTTESTGLSGGNVVGAIVLGAYEAWRNPSPGFINFRRMVAEMSARIRGRRSGGTAADTMSGAPPPVFGTVYGQPSPRTPSAADIAKAKQAIATAEWQEVFKKLRGRKGKARIRKKKLLEARDAIVKRVIAALPKDSRIVRVLKRFPKGAGPVVAAQVAYELGRVTGAAIWEAYGTRVLDTIMRDPAGVPGGSRAIVSQKRPAGAHPRVLPPQHAHKQPITPPRTISRAAPVRAPVARTAPKAPPAPVQAPVTVPRASTATQSVPTTVRAPAPPAPRSKWTLPKVSSLPAVFVNTGTANKPKAAPLTLTSTQPVRSAPTTQRTRECECPKERKRSGSRCRNPITRRTKRTRGGQRYITITRRIECNA